MNKPKLLILDEPTVGVDAKNIDRFYKTINELNTIGVSVILITHDIKSSKAQFTHVMHMHNGDATMKLVKKDGDA